jgi:acyl-coenzyme A synthetase/AMP-(fatty) acid ligase/acyl carrier protein
MREQSVTRMQAVPSQWRALLEAGFEGPETIGMTGGEALSPALARRLRARLRGLLNAYGPTETTIVSTIWPVPPGVTDVAVGEPIANTRLYLLDDRHEPVPPGEAGELYIAGEGVALEYVARAGLTAERFPVDPQGPPGSRMYRTGDLCRWRPDGMLAFIGRDDGQVKVRGQRVELGEVETRLAAHPGVAAVAAAVRDDSLVAYIVPDITLTGPETGISASIREYARGTLPASMVPNLVEVLAELPLTGNGKIDRSALPAPSPGPAAPGSGEEDEWLLAVCEICREALGVPVVRPEDDLVELGAHSLTLMQITARMRARWNVEIPVDVFYEAERVADVAAAVAELL